MIETDPFTEAQWWRMCDVNMELPVPLAKADLSRPFVYCRQYGVFFVGYGHHQSAMSLLLAFECGVRGGIEVGKLLGLKFPYETADRWLEQTPGAAFKSSVSSKVYAWRPENLTVIEKRFLGPIEFLSSK